MENFYLSALVEEMRPTLVHQVLGRVALVGSDTGSELWLDFNLRDRQVLRATVEPASASLFLVHETAGRGNDAHPFAAALRKRLLDARLTAISKPPLDRIVRLDFETFDAGGERSRAALILAFTGRTSNAYLLSADDTIETALKLRGGLAIGDRFLIQPTPFDAEQIIGAVMASATQEEILQTYFNSAALFSPLLEKEFLARCKTAAPAAAFASLLRDAAQEKPRPAIYSRLPLDEIGDHPLNLKTDLLLAHFPLALAGEMNEYRFETLSAAAARFQDLRGKALAYLNRFASVKKLVADELKKRESLLLAICQDKEKFEEPERFKRMGDLLLANISSASVRDNRVRVVDYYSEEQPEIDIELGEGKTIQQAANDYFAHYQKSRRALDAIATREATIQEQARAFRELRDQLGETPSADRIIEVRAQAERLLGVKGRKAEKSPAQRQATGRQIGRWYLSPSGYEIVVGRNDRDNDTITFRVAASQDIWLHAADYPGSHVVIRNPSRKEVPMKVVQEAAELAAFHSQAKKQGKVAIHYTQKKFVTKPPRSKPGLVRLSSFKTVLVEPKNTLERLEKSAS